MKAGHKVTISAVMGIAALAGAAAQADDTRPKNRFAAELLDAHNAARSDFGAARLEWDDGLAQQARKWAEVLAREGQMRHATQSDRIGMGENLWMGSAGVYSASDMVGSFVDEQRDFRAGTFPKVSRTGNWRDVGHFTQVVWHATSHVGCAVARNARDDFLVCRYWPAGNTYGVEIAPQRSLASR